MAVVDKEEYVSVYFEHGEAPSVEDERQINSELQDLGVNVKLEFESSTDGLKIKAEKYPK